MDPIFGGLAAAGGSLAAGGLNFLGAREANKMNLKIAREQMQFQERMSSTAYQRAVQDLESAGLNPMLAYQQGGASSPGGASATMQNELAPAVSSALDMRRAIAEVKNLSEQNKNLQKENDRIESQTELNDALAEAAQADTVLKSNSAVNIQQENWRRWIDTALNAMDSGVAGHILKRLRSKR